MKIWPFNELDRLRKENGKLKGELLKRKGSSHLKVLVYRLPDSSFKDDPPPEDRRWRARIVDHQGRGMFNYAGPSTDYATAAHRAWETNLEREIVRE